MRPLLAALAIAAASSSPAAIERGGATNALPRVDGVVSTAALDADVRAFLAREPTAHVADIRTIDPPPDRVVGAQTTGEVVVPTAANRWITTTSRGGRADQFDGRDGRLTVSMPRIDWPHAISVHASENTPLGRGARGAVPLHLNVESSELALRPGEPTSWVLELRVEGH